MADLDLDRWTELYRRVCALPRADPGGFSDALELAALAASELRRVRAERDRLARAVDRAWALADQCVPWRAGATGRGSVTAGELRSALAVPTPDAPAGPPYEPLAVQEPPTGGIGPTEAQRGAEGVACSRPHTMSMPPGRIDFPLRCPECGDLVTIWVGSTAVSARYVPGGPVPPTQWYLVGEGDPVNITADVDTVSGERREGERG